MSEAEFPFKLNTVDVNISNKPPDNPVAGQTYLDTSTNQVKVYTGDEWLVIGTPAPSEAESQPFIGNVTSSAYIPSAFDSMGNMNSTGFSNVSGFGYAAQDTNPAPLSEKLKEPEKKKKKYPAKKDLKRSIDI